MVVAVIERSLLVDGHDDRLGARFLRGFARLAILLQFFPWIQLEPERSAVRFGDLGERHAGHVADNHRRLGCLGTPGVCRRFLVRVQCTVRGGGGEHDRKL